VCGPKYHTTHVVRVPPVSPHHIYNALVINIIIPVSGTHMMCGDKCHTEQSATPHTWWDHLLGSVGATSRIHNRVSGNQPSWPSTWHITWYMMHLVTQ